MKILLKDVKFPPHLNLAFQCDTAKTDWRDRDYKVASWAPKRAKSFQIVSEDYRHGGKGWLNGSVEIAYFTTANEGLPLEPLRLAAGIGVKPRRKNPLLERLRHHVTGAIERGEGVAIVGIPAA